MQANIIERFHYITQDDIQGLNHVDLARFACEGGAKWVQLRVKNKDYKEWESIAVKVKNVCNYYNTKLIINDNFKLAKEIEADGVHLGKMDGNLIQARSFLGNDFIIGGTANTLQDVISLISAKADYIGLGPFHFTHTKKNLSPVLGIEGIVRIISQLNLHSLPPIIAIGGIKTENVNKILKAGCYGIAVSSGVNCSQNKIKATRSYLEAIEYCCTVENKSENYNTFQLY